MHFKTLQTTLARILSQHKTLLFKYITKMHFTFTSKRSFVLNACFFVANLKKNVMIIFLNDIRQALNTLKRQK